MKPNRPSLIAAFIATLLVGAGAGYGLFASGVVSGPSHAGFSDQMTAASGEQATAASQGQQPTGKPVYTCPMHPQVVADRPGQCPICGMDLVIKQASATTQAPTATSANTQPAPQGKPVYTCPMHPQVISDNPGQCPICGMDLVLKQAAATTAPAATGSGTGGAAAELEPGVQAVTLSPRQRVLANIETAPVGSRSLSRSLETTGRVAYDEARLQSLSAWIDGRIDYLAVKTTGASIAKGSVIARIYSPELVATQQEYLTARASAREMAKSPYPELAQGARSVVSAARQRLRLMGITESQIRQVEATGRPIVSFPILAPASGVVVERKVQQGQYVKAGDTLFDLADYSRVWVEASVYEADLGTVKAGARAEVRVTGLPDRVFSGRVSFIQPVVGAETRTGQLRIELANPQGVLKPEMYANVRILSPIGGKDQLSVPASAVIATGRHHVVYVEVAPNQFVPRTVMVGAKTDQYYPVFSGLKAGEKVATSGAFLLDASTQLMGGSTSSHEGHDAGAPEEGTR
jgi:Cu(I)/Ag(I) efflux system membrane fusion protein